MITDTGNFSFPGVTQETFRIAAELISKGADREKIIFEIERNLDENTLKLVGEILNKIEIDKEHNVKNTDFGMIMVETEKNNLSISFRSRGGFDVSQIALEFGGGGHKAAAGATIKGMEFSQAVGKVLEVARKYAKKN
jgi:phosphoesterase RecJ-like protein